MRDVMHLTTLTSREFNHDTGRAKKAMQQGPVFIADRGRPAQVLLTFEEFQRLSGGMASILDLLAMPGLEEVELEPLRVEGPYRPADFA
jgi:PHD/YefM family antitoxin component YafN of YafNO toxin-antitoxin module